MKMNIFLVIGIIIVIVLLLSLLWWKFYFLRNPKRKIPQDPQSIVSPADGTIMKIIPFSQEQPIMITVEKKYLGKIKTIIGDLFPEGYLLAIFMSPMDVHYNRAPIEGIIIKQQHTPGSFHKANDFWKSLENEKNEIIIKNNNLTIKVIQVAGILARRIESFVEEGQAVKKGQIIGRINLGSQVILILPKTVSLTVKEGDYIQAGSSVIGTITKKTKQKENIR